MGKDPKISGTVGITQVVNSGGHLEVNGKYTVPQEPLPLRGNHSDPGGESDTLPKVYVAVAIDTDGSVTWDWNFDKMKLATKDGDNNWSVTTPAPPGDAECKTVYYRVEAYALFKNSFTVAHTHHIHHKTLS